MKVFIPRYIKSEADLPKKTGSYFVYVKDTGIDIFDWFKSNDKHEKNYWCNTFDYWLDEVELPDENEWVSVLDKLPKEHIFGLSRDVLTIAGNKMSVKCYDHELKRWSGSPHVKVKYWMDLPSPPTKTN